MIVTFSDARQAEVLLASVVRFKFDCEAESDLFVGSPVHAAALKALFGAVVAGASQGDAAERWRENYRLSGSPERRRFVERHAAEHPKWLLLSESDQVDWVENVAAPYWFSPEEFAEMKTQIDSIVSG